MTLLRRAPREVYRVYDEDEFFSEAAREEQFDTVAREPGTRSLHRVAGTTMLLAVMGAVGGLIAVSSLPSARDSGRRAGTRLLAATGSLLAGRAHVWRGQADSGGPRHQSPAGPRARSVARVGSRPRVNILARAGSHRQATKAALQRDSAPVEVAAQVAPPASVARLTAAASTGPRQSGQPEFGFER